MKKSWKVVIYIIMTAIVLGLICVGVGMLTGADFDRIYQILDNRFDIEQWRVFFQESMRAASELQEIIASEVSAI